MPKANLDTIEETNRTGYPPPFAAVHVESIMTDPSNWIVGPPEIRNAGQPRRPFGQDAFDGSRRTIE